MLTFVLCRHYSLYEVSALVFGPLAYIRAIINRRQAETRPSLRYDPICTAPLGPDGNAGVRLAATIVNRTFTDVSPGIESRNYTTSRTRYQISGGRDQQQQMIKNSIQLRSLENRLFHLEMRLHANGVIATASSCSLHRQISI